MYKEILSFYGMTNRNVVLVVRLFIIIEHSYQLVLEIFIMYFLGFAVEYRCVGSRSDKFIVTLYFNISWPSENRTTAFNLKQEKLCAGRDGRRILDGEFSDMNMINTVRKFITK